MSLKCSLQMNVLLQCPVLPFNCHYPFSTKVNICRNSENKIKRFIMFLHYSKLHIKFLKYQLLIYSHVKRYWFPRWFFWFFWLSFLAIISPARSSHCFLHQITKKEFNNYIIYMIKLEIFIIYIQFDKIFQFGFMNSIFFFVTFPLA